MVLKTLKCKMEKEAKKEHQEHTPDNIILIYQEPERLTRVTLYLGY